MSNDGPYYNERKVYINIMENLSQKIKYGSEMWSRLFICIDLLRYIEFTFSKSRRIEFKNKTTIAALRSLE